MAESKACEVPLAQGPRKGLSATGTAWGYQRHLNADEQACDACLAAAAKRQRDFRDEKRVEYPANPVCLKPIRSGPNRGQTATGTKAGYDRHRRVDETPCDECATWHADWYRQYRERPGNREKALAYGRRYYAENAEHLRAVSREWGQEHRDEVTERARKWRDANRERHRETSRERARRRRAQLNDVLVLPFTDDQLTARLSMFAGCWICGGDADTIDHVKPVSKGGAHILSNIRPACQPCNTRKKDKWPLDVAVT